MTVNFDLVIDTENDFVDMKAALTSMQGVSDAVRCISESILTERVPERLTSRSSVRTSLKKSFKGSYGHIFSLDVYDSVLLKRLNGIGQQTIVELISHFISESLYRDSGPLSQKAQKVIDRLGEKAEMVVHQLRTSSLGNIHEISLKFDRGIKIRHRKNRDEQTVLACFDKLSATVLQAELSDVKVDLNVVITRLNIHTGNGRLQIEGASETVAFGFASACEYRDLAIAVKKVFSENLNYNNGIESGKWKYLAVSVSPLKLKDGKVVKYFVRGFHES
ncbi:hypothetical protein [Niveibacterium terrae]|uniref:hypothetical protein n=1 Tax=Niveibacterium terrae TaxID=3373598 RepID=UPI003A9404DB